MSHSGDDGLLLWERLVLSPAHASGIEVKARSTELMTARSDKLCKYVYERIQGRDLEVMIA